MKEKAEKMFLRAKIISKSKGIKVNKAPRGINDKIEDDEKDDTEIDEVELSTSEQWERVNDLLLLITTIMIFNATSLFIGIIQITWRDEGTVFDRTIVLQSQKIIGKPILLIFTKCMG